jgi:hypothetical protein
LYKFINALGDTIYDNYAGGVVVLDSFSDNKKTATVLFATLRLLIVAELKINNLGSVEHSILKRLEMPLQTSQAHDNDNILLGQHRRLTLLGTNKEGGDMVYHIATGNPYYKSETYSTSGRVYFFSLRENLWVLTQPNNKGITSGDGLLFTQGTAFGSDLVSVGDLDDNGYNDLAVLLPASNQFPNGAIYIFFMDNEYTPSLKNSTLITGSSMPWIEPAHNGLRHNCKGMSSATWKQAQHLLISCFASVSDSTITFIKDISLDSNGSILHTSILSSEKKRNAYSNLNPSSNPVPIRNHENFAVVLPISEPCGYCSRGSLYIYQVKDADFSKNFSMEVAKTEAIADIDSLFYRSGTEGYSAKTLAGLATCFLGIYSNDLLCKADENAYYTWSMIELSSISDCEPYRVCKKKDTIYVYARGRIDPANTALRIPKDIVIPMQNGIFNIENMNSLVYFRNPKSLVSNLFWNQAGLKYSTVFSNSSDIVSIVPLLNEGIDTIVFSMSISNATDYYPVRLHIADTSKILKSAIPATPGSDTVWNTAQKKYIALPHSNSNGSLYTYDLYQHKLGKYAEIAGDYLHILEVDVADIFILYTENYEVKQRKITLMPELKALPPDPPEQGPSSIAAATQAQNLKAMRVNGGLQISGLNGEFELRSYNFKGVEIQREKASAQGSAFLKLRQNCPQIVQIKSAEEKIYFSIFPIYGAP